MLKLIECPRDAMQGLKSFIKTEDKAKYLNTLLKIGFDTIDFGSFVSPKAIPQLRDTAEVLKQIELGESTSKLSAIVANLRGAKDAVLFEEIDYLGYPFSISEIFQIRNTNSTIEQSLSRVEEIQEVCFKANKKLTIYISMGFGNPYGDEWNVEIVQHWVNVLAEMGIKIMNLSDTIGVADPKSISYLFGNLIPPYPDVEFGAHLHTEPHNWEEKVYAAWENGCRRFDSAIRGYGGCPFAKEELVGNMPTENLLFFLDKIGHRAEINSKHFQESMKMALEIFPQHEVYNHGTV